MAFDLVDLMC